MDKLRENLPKIVIGIFIYILVIIFLIAPIAVGFHKKDLFKGMESFTEEVASFSSISRALTEAYRADFGKAILVFSAVAAGLAIYAAVKNKSRGPYQNKEHGSSDWSKNGEQYRILSRNKGLILAENNYLPTDKKRKC
jgi:hypothetical protein